MKLTASLEGLKEVQDGLRFSARRVNSVGVAALNGAAREVGAGWQREMTGKFDRPTRQTLNSVVIIPAKPNNLEATVLIRDQARSGGRAPAEWLMPGERGGSRFKKKFEEALTASGAMPGNMRVVPGKHAKLDAFGNVSRGQIVQVLAQLGAQLSPGYQRVISPSQKRRAQKALLTGRNYVAVAQKQRGGPSPGVYQRKGKLLLPVFFYVSSVQYRKRIALVDLAKRDAPALITRQLERQFQASAERLLARGVNR